jgi:hypothetical protein
LTTDDAYAFDRIRQTVVAQFNFDDGILKTTLGADKVMVSVPTSNGDAKEVWDEETSETGTFEPTYAIVYGSIDIEVSVIYAGSCLPTECDDIDPNILHAFDFCKPSVFAQLTPEQLTCLEGEICVPLCEQLADVLPEDVVADVFDCLTLAAQTELLDSECVIPPCSPVTQQVNGTTIGTTASGGTNNQLIRNTAGTAVGTSANPSIVANSTYTLKKSGGTTISTGVIAAEASANITAPDATAVVKDTANNTISTTPIQSDSSANITAPNGTYSLRDTASNVLGTGSIRSGQLAVVITAPDATVRNSVTPTWTATEESGGTLTLAQGKALDSDGSTTLLANYIPTTDGFMFTCTPAAAVPVLAVTLSDDTPNFGDVVLITATPTGITPTSYTFSVPLADGSGHQIITQTGLGMNVLVWTAVYYGALTITVTATDGVSEPSDTVAVTVSYTFGNAATLNGSQWFTTITANVINDILNGRTFQVGVWFNAVSLANFPVLISQVSAGNNFLIQVDATHVYVYCGGSLTTYNQVVNTGQRNHILFQKTGNGSNRLMYFNGVAVAPASGSSIDLSYVNSGLYIGRWSSGGVEFNGKEKDVVVHQSFNSSAAQALAYYNAGNGSHPSVLGKFPDWWLWLNSDGDDKGRLNQDVTGTNTPTFTAF